jgi:hypothetical protein
MDPPGAISAGSQGDPQPDNKVALSRSVKSTLLYTIHVQTRRSIFGNSVSEDLPRVLGPTAARGLEDRLEPEPGPPDDGTPATCIPK